MDNRLEVEKHMRSWPDRVKKAVKDKDRGLSRKIIADRIGINYNYLIQILKGKDITVNTYKKIERGLRKLKI